ncbi:hypothetical protein Tco_0733105 [Tanacetum coccineum]
MATQVPCLKWGNQKLLHCIKVHPDDDDVAPVKKCFRSSSSEENKKMKSMMIGDDDEIEATREKLMPKKQLDHHLLQKQLDISPDLYKGKRQRLGINGEVLLIGGSLRIYEMIFDGLWDMEIEMEIRSWLRYYIKAWAYASAQSAPFDNTTTTALMGEQPNP